MSESINKRKAEHIELCLTDQVTGKTITTGMESVRLVHNALPEIDLDDVSLTQSFLGFKRKTPFLISSMTGGAELAETINRNLAIAAEERGWTFALGSTRALVENKEFRPSFQIRKYAPTVPIIANLGAVQLNYGFGVEKCQQIVDITEADVLVLHLNAIQEVIQTGGDTNFAHLLGKIESLVKKLDIPVGVKEVGWGIDGTVAKQLRDVGVSFIDVAGAGGTSWSQVEKLRSKDKIKKEAAEAFVDWGIPTVESIVSVRDHVSDIPVIASGGMKTGLDAAKAIAIGADMVGFARSILREATESVDKLLELMETRELEMQMAMFALGVRNINELKQTNRVIIS
ncbi:Isopentenyl-diphosphate delta-isomerase [Paraliobacillus sp. PM-2]|uniref:type 2 isopentenyl-diphosphate Delta-isomerase n=1 Tax=Paraliobacillus sp. PM-2 TaxID=1462524 RepID=UPI00061C9D21|nr:type 2 isopentenyl-diphosphate Delta-isomerase [Paraliobacillus sp. PM-2]CQR48388.1 Isopentenyl-diphosphate delta-isomerase [Paraliobacillus sp. PM-2]